MAAARLSQNRRLADCPEWPTSHTLPRAAVVALERTLIRLRMAGVPARLQDVVGMAIVVFAPETASGLVAVMTKPHPQLKATVAQLPTGRYQRLLGTRDEQLMVRLPSPVTLRLNLLIEQVHADGFRATRRQVLSAVALHCLPRDRATLASAYDRYRTANAEDAGVVGRPLTDVLSLRRPKPGRRPMS